MSMTDIERLQSVGQEAQAARHEFILKDDQDAVWDHLRSLSNSRVDIVLDNCTLSSQCLLRDQLTSIISVAGFEVGPVSEELDFRSNFQLAFHRFSIRGFLGDLHHPH